MPVRTDHFLKDVNYGSWCGLTWSMVQKEDARMYAKFLKSPKKFKFPVGEKMKKGGRRAQSFAHWLFANFGTGNLVIVADDLIICLLASHMAKVDLSRIEPWKPSGGKMSTLECVDGKCVIKKLRGTLF